MTPCALFRRNILPFNSTLTMEALCSSGTHRIKWLHTALMRGPRRSLSRREGQKFLLLSEMNPCCPVTAPSHPDSIFYNRLANCKSQPFVCLKAWFISSTFQLVLTELMPQLTCQIGDTDGKQFAPIVIPLLFSPYMVFNPFPITFHIKYIIPTHRMFSAH